VGVAGEHQSSAPVTCLLDMPLRVRHENRRCRIRPARKRLLNELPMLAVLTTGSEIVNTRQHQAGPQFNPAVAQDLNTSGFQESDTCIDASVELVISRDREYTQRRRETSKYLAKFAAVAVTFHDISTKDDQVRPQRLNLIDST